MPGQREQIVDLWAAISREVRAHFRRAFQKPDAPHATLLLLRHIDREPGLTIADLARRSGMVKSYVSTTTEQLVRAGHVVKCADPGDQRLVRVYLTQSAAERRADMEARARDAWAAVIDEIPEEELGVVRRGLTVFLAALERSAERHAPAEPATRDRSTENPEP